MGKRGQLALTEAACPLSLLIASISAPSCSHMPAETLICDNAKSESSSDLAKQNQNPVSDLISLPPRNNVNLGYGSGYGTQNFLPAQPLVLFHVSNDWNIVPERSCRSSGSLTPRQVLPCRPARGRDRPQHA